jgi:flagellin-specific chaperone FliS
MDRLTFANLKNDLTAMDEADQVLDQVHEAFNEAVKTYKGNQRPGSTGSDENREETSSQMTGKLSVAV